MNLDLLSDAFVLSTEVIQLQRSDAALNCTGACSSDISWLVDAAEPDWATDYNHAIELCKCGFPIFSRLKCSSVLSNTVEVCSRCLMPNRKVTRCTRLKDCDGHVDNQCQYDCTIRTRGRYRSQENEQSLRGLADANPNGEYREKCRLLGFFWPPQSLRTYLSDTYIYRFCSKPFLDEWLALAKARVGLQKDRLKALAFDAEIKAICAGSDELTDHIRDLNNKAQPSGISNEEKLGLLTLARESDQRLVEMFETPQGYTGID